MYKNLHSKKRIVFYQSSSEFNLCFTHSTLQVGVYSAMNYSKEYFKHVVHQTDGISFLFQKRFKFFFVQMKHIMLVLLYLYFIAFSYMPFRLGFPYLFSYFISKYFVFRCVTIFIRSSLFHKISYMFFYPFLFLLYLISLKLFCFCI